MVECLGEGLIPLDRLWEEHEPVDNLWEGLDPIDILWEGQESVEILCEEEDSKEDLWDCSAEELWAGRNSLCALGEEWSFGCRAVRLGDGVGGGRGLGDTDRCCHRFLRCWLPLFLAAALAPPLLALFGSSEWNPSGVVSLWKNPPLLNWLRLLLMVMAVEAVPSFRVLGVAAHDEDDDGSRLKAG